jgi:hypothetical protein
MGHLVVTLLEVAVISFEESEADARVTFLGLICKCPFVTNHPKFWFCPHSYFALGLPGSSQHGNVGRSATSS